MKKMLLIICLTISTTVFAQTSSLVIGGVLDLTVPEGGSSGKALQLVAIDSFLFRFLQDLPAQPAPKPLLRVEWRLLPPIASILPILSPHLAWWPREPAALFGSSLWSFHRDGMWSRFLTVSEKFSPRPAGKLCRLPG